MKTNEFMSALSAEEVRNVNGGFITIPDIITHEHVMVPEPGSCSCVPGEFGIFTFILQGLR